MGYYKTTHNSSSSESNKAKEAVIKKAFQNISGMLIIISVAIMFGEVYVAYTELFGNGPFRSLGSTLIVTFLIIVQLVGIILNLILKMRLKKRNLLGDEDRKLSSIPIRLLFFNILLALVLTLIVNISNGNVTQLFNSTK